MASALRRCLHQIGDNILEGRTLACGLVPFVLTCCGARLLAQGPDTSMKALNDRWATYLSEIQTDNDYPNWSGPPHSLYLSRLKRAEIANARWAEAQSKVDEGVSSFKEGEYREALSRFLEAAILEPNDTTIQRVIRETRQTIANTERARRGKRKAPVQVAPTP